MGCMGERQKPPPESSQRWDFITLSDFRCTSNWTSLAYVWLWIMAFVGIAVYVVDTFTAVNLLAFDRWSSSVKPALDFKYSKWIFSICILISWALCFYEWIRAIRVIRRGAIADDFLDPLAVNIQSMRNQGWRRFLVFTELTKSKKGADYVALFVYFSFKTAFRVILAEGPRQGVNAMTLYAVLTADIIPTKATDHSSFEQFWINVGALFDQDRMQGVIYCGMLFTLVIWVFSALSLIISAILYIVFLWHYIPQRDGKLSVYCKRKVEKRLERLVANKVQKAIEDEERQQRKAEEKAQIKRQKNGELPPPVVAQIGMNKQPTLPCLPSPESKLDDRLPEFPLRRQATDGSVATLPLYSAGPPDRTERLPTLPNVDHEEAHPTMTRSNSAWSSAPSYSTQAPLLSHAGVPGQSEPPLPPLPPTAHYREDSYGSTQQPWHDRSGSGGSAHGSVQSFNSGPPRNLPRPYPPRPGPGYSRGPPPLRGPTPMRTNTPMTYEQELPSAASTTSQYSFSKPLPPTARSNTTEGFRPVGPPMRTNTAGGFHRGPVVHDSVRHLVEQEQADSHWPTQQQMIPDTHFSSTVRNHEHYEMTTSPSHNAPGPQFPPPSNTNYINFRPGPTAPTPAPSTSGGYVAFTPSGAPGPQRNLAIAHAANGSGDYFSDVRQVPQRSATAPIEPQSAQHMRQSVNDILDDYGEPRRPAPAENPVQYRSHTAR